MDLHVTESALSTLFAGTCTGEEADETVAHVAACRDCWRLAAVALGKIRKARSFAPSPSGSALAKTIRVEDRYTMRAMRAQAALDSLRQLSPSEQRKKLDTTRYMRTQLFFKALIRAIPSLIRSDPHAAEGFALLARDVAERLPKSGYPEQLRAELRAEALIHIANCRRLCADFSAARSALLEALKLLKSSGGLAGSRVRQAYWFINSAALQMDLGHFEQALDLLKNAEELYTAEGDAEGLSLSAAQGALIYLAACRFTEALAQADRALTIPTISRRLQMIVRCIKVESLVREHRITEGRMMLSELQSFFEEFPDYSAYDSYLNAVILDATGFPKDAEQRFREASRRFIETEHYRDAMLVQFTHFETLVQRGAFNNAVLLCNEVLGEPNLLDESRTEIRSAWLELRALADRRAALDALKLQTFRQYFARCWSKVASLQSFEASFTTTANNSSPAMQIDDEPFEPPRIEETAWPQNREDYLRELERREQELFTSVVVGCNYSIRATAKTLRMSRNTVAAKMEKFGIARKGCIQAVPSD